MAGTIRDKVIWCLQKHPAFRDNKRELIAYVLKTEFARLYPDTPPNEKYDQFIEALTEGKLSHPETIAREWRKVQQEIPELQGLKFNERHGSQQERVKTTFNYNKTV